MSEPPAVYTLYTAFANGPCQRLAQWLRAAQVRIVLSEAQMEGRDRDGTTRVRPWRRVLFATSREPVHTSRASGGETPDAICPRGILPSRGSCT